MSYQSRNAPRLADLLMRQGEIAASKVQNRGNFVSALVQGVAGIPAGIQQRRLAEQEKREEAIDRNLGRANIASQIGEREASITERTRKHDDEETAKRGMEWLIEVATAPDLESKRMAYKVGRDALIREGRMKPGETRDFFPGDSWLRLKVAKQSPGLAKLMFPDPEKLEQRDPTKDLFRPSTGEVVTPGTPAPQTDFEWVTRGRQVVQIPKGTAQSGDRPYQPPSQAQPQYLWAVDPATGETRRMTEDEARRAGAAQPVAGSGMGPAAVQLRNSRAAAALNGVEQLKKLSPERMSGPLGILQGLWQVISAYAGLNPDVRQFQALRKPVAMQMAVAVQGAANLSDTERKVMAEMLGSIATMDVEAQKALLDSAAELIQNSTDVTKVGDTWVPVTRKIRVATGALEELERRRKARGQ